MRKIMMLAAGLGALSLAACGEGEAPDPSGELEIVGDAEDFMVGDVIILDWTTENTTEVFIAMSVDGGEDQMLSETAFAASGTREFEIEPGALTFTDDDDLDLTFKLMARDDEGEMDTLDTDTIEVSRDV